MRGAQIANAAVSAAAAWENNMFDFEMPAAAHHADTSSSPPDSVLSALFDEVDSGVLLCDVDGLLLWANDAAHSELGAPSGLALAGRHLQAASTPPSNAALRDCALGGRRQLLRLGGDGECGPALVYLLPVSAAVQGRRCVAILLGRRSQRSNLTFELLANLYRLSRAERDVLLALVAGKRAAQIASERGVQLSTVRSQIMALRDKSGASSIAALISLVAQMPPVAGALRRGGGTSSAHGPMSAGLARAG